MVREFRFPNLSLLPDRPGIGVAKTRLLGTHSGPANRAGAWTELKDGGKTIGAVLRCRAGVKPVYISVGHKLDLPTTVELVLACSDGCCIPKPTREADHYAGQLKRRQISPP